MKNSIFALAITGLFAISCGTSSQYASSRFDDAIYTNQQNKVTISSTDLKLQDLKKRTAETSTLIVNGKEVQVYYMDETQTVDIPVNVDEENTYIVIDKSVSYEELLRKFDSPDFTINLQLETRWSDWDYYGPSRWGYNPWSWSYYGRNYRPWSNFSYYPYYWRDPFFYNFYYSYGSYYDPWNPYWYYGGYYPHHNYYGNFAHNGYYNSGNYYGNNGSYYNGSSNNRRGTVYGKRVTDGRDGNNSDRSERAVITNVPRQSSGVNRSTTRGNEQSASAPVNNSVYRRGNSSGTGVSYGEKTVNSRERSTTYSRSNENGSNSQRQSTGTYRRSTTPVSNSSEGVRNSGNTYNSNQYRRNNSSSDETQRSNSNVRSGNSSTRNTGTRETSATRSESTSTRSNSNSSSSSSSSSSSTSSSSSSGRSSSSSGSTYRR